MTYIENSRFFKFLFFFFLGGGGSLIEMMRIVLVIIQLNIQSKIGRSFSILRQLANVLLFFEVPGRCSVFPDAGITSENSAAWQKSILGFL